MIVRSLKWGVAVATGAILLGGLLFGRDVASYVSTGVRQVRHTVQENIPIEVELERARDMITKITPELRKNVRLIVNEEIAVKNLRGEISLAQDNVASQRRAVASLRDHLSDTQHVSYVVSGRELSRGQVVEKLASRLSRYKGAQAELASKQKMLEIRERSLAAAQEMYDQSRTRQVELKQKVEALVARHRLIKAQAVATSIHIDDSQLARADRLMQDIDRRLETAQRVLHYEAELDTMNYDEVIDESDLIEEVDACLGECDDFDVLMTDAEADDAAIARIAVN